MGRTVENSSDGAAAAAAVGFALVGGAVAGLDGRLRGRRSPAPLARLTVAVLALGALASHDGADRWSSLALAFPLLSVGVLLARPSLQPMRAILGDTPGAALLRRLAPLVVGAALVLPMLALGGA